MMSPQEFQKIIFQKGRDLYRDMPWRQDTRPYYVLVSELMLQQTQVDRVIPKFNAFITAFPDEKVLDGASLADVLVAWQGLGYNRRAKYLHEAAKEVVRLGGFPSDKDGLMSLPGVGPNTAGAIMVYAHNQPVVFVETNIRTVYFHHFFHDHNLVNDKQIVELVEQTMDHEYPREFYWALMDYGTWLKKQGTGQITKSKHYKKQSPLIGSVREVRGKIVRSLTVSDITERALRYELDADERFASALNGLVQDGLVGRSREGKLHLTK